MKRKGSILILTLLVFVVLMMGALYVLHSSTIHMHIANNKSTNNQGFYSSEAKVYMCMYEDKYYKNQLHALILNEFRKNDPKPKDYILLSSEDIEKGDSERKVAISFVTQNNRKCLKLVGTTNNNNQITNATSTFTLVNEIFELGLPVLDRAGEYIEELENKISNDDLPRQIKAVNIFDYDSILVKTITNRELELSYGRMGQFIRSEKLIPSNIDKTNELFILIEDKFDKGVNLHIDCPEKLTLIDGIIYIEGDLIISSEFKFNGIIIINNGQIIVNSEIKPIINGIIISNGEETWIDLEKITLKYDENFVYRYGTYLPNFLNYEFLVMKKTK